MDDRGRPSRPVSRTKDARRTREIRLGRRESPMLFGNRGPRPSHTRRGTGGTFQPCAEGLENRVLLTGPWNVGGGTPVNLAGQTTVPPNGPQTIAGQLPGIADFIQGNQTTDPGLGILETGNLQNQG